MKKGFEKTVQIPQGVHAEVTNNFVKVKEGSREVSKKFSSKDLQIIVQGSVIKIVSNNSKTKSLSVANAIVSHLANLLHGLKKDFEYKLEIVYSHFPMNVAVKEGFVEITNIAGAKMPKKAKIVGTAKVVVKGKEVTVSSSNKDHAGQTAANLEIATKIRGKDRRVFQDGIYIVSKPKFQSEKK